MSIIEYLEERAKRGSRQKFEAVLANVPDVEPEVYDQLQSASSMIFPAAYRKRQSSRSSYGK